MQLLQYLTEQRLQLPQDAVSNILFQNYFFLIYGIYLNKSYKLKIN